MALLRIMQRNVNKKYRVLPELASSCPSGGFQALLPVKKMDSELAIFRKIGKYLVVSSKKILATLTKSQSEKTKKHKNLTVH